MTLTDSARQPRTAVPVVASVPSGHVYVRHLEPVRGAAVARRLDDPDPDRPDAPAQSRWWPPAMLDARWVEGADVDLFHLHFGFDDRSPDDLERLVRTLRARGIPLVFTVHDLRNPHHGTREVHDAQLDVLVPAADALVTLTDGAADEIQRRWGRRPAVVPHPHVVDLDLMGRLQRARRSRPRGPFRVGLHVKSLRASMSPLAILPVLVEAVRSLPDAVLQVNGHRDVLDADGARRDVALATFLQDASDAGDLELRVHDFMSDDDLCTYLASLDVSVLPYRFGTHSGWLEACRDLGTHVVAPSCGYYADQGPVLTYTLDEDLFDPDSLVSAVHRAHALGAAQAISPAERAAQRDEVAAAHRDVYARARR